MTAATALRLATLTWLCSIYGLSASPNDQQPACDRPFEPADGSYKFIEEETDGYQAPADARVGKIRYTRLKIFDESNPEENSWLFRWANRFHILTREHVIARQMLFEEGQVYDGRRLDESARLLRRQDYLYDVDVRPVRTCDGKVEVEVITKDVWSFTPDISFDRSGGENTYSFSLREANIFGYGKEVSISSKSDTDRDSNQFLYRDNNVLGSRIATQIHLSDNDDGSNEKFRIALPFYSLESTFSWAVNLEHNDRVESQYFKGDEVTEVRQEVEEYIFQLGFSNGLKDDLVQRWRIGYQYRSDEFDLGDELPPPDPFPWDRELSYPFVAFEALEDDYTTAFNLDQIHRTEDLHLGYRFYNRVGYAATGFGSDQDRAVMQGFFSDTLLYNEHILWRHEMEWEGVWNLDTGYSEDVLVDYKMRYFRRQTSHRSFFASVAAVWTHNLNNHQQVVLGGLTGARGFENRFQVGDRLWSLTLEERMYTDIHLWNLLRLGWALFIDVGRAWEPGVDDGLEDTNLANAGFGIRLASSKAEAGRIAHIDFAFPLTNKDDPQVDSYLIAVNIKNEF